MTFVFDVFPEAGVDLVMTINECNQVESFHVFE